MNEAAKKRHAAMYAAKVSWVDNWVGVFLDTLEQTGLDKRTAVILTADHGTHVGERGFGKRAPVWEQVARIPFIVHVPSLGGGRSKVIVQPQDIFATICGIAGVETPEGLSSNDALATAITATPSDREIALAGLSLDHINPDAQRVFSAFNREWCMEVGLKPELSRLRRMGSLDDVASEHQDVVQAMHAEALTELARRGIAPEMLKWMRSGGEGDFPWDCRFYSGYPKPRNYRAYFTRLYHGK